MQTFTLYMNQTCDFQRSSQLIKNLPNLLRVFCILRDISRVICAQMARFTLTRELNWKKKQKLYLKIISTDIPWFFSVSKLLVAGRNISIRSGTRRIILKAHNAAFFFMYAFGDFISLSTSDARSRAISGEAIAPNVQRARPTTNCVLLFRSLWIMKRYLVL